MHDMKCSPRMAVGGGSLCLPIVKWAALCTARSCHRYAQECALVRVAVEITTNSCRHLRAEIFGTFKQAFEHFAGVVLPEKVSFRRPVQTGYLKGPLAGPYRYGRPCPSSELVQFVLLMVFRQFSDRCRCYCPYESASGDGIPDGLV